MVVAVNKAVKTDSVAKRILRESMESCGEFLSEVLSDALLGGGGDDISRSCMCK